MTIKEAWDQYQEAKLAATTAKEIMEEKWNIWMIENQKELEVKIRQRIKEERHGI